MAQAGSGSDGTTVAAQATAASVAGSGGAGQWVVPARWSVQKALVARPLTSVKPYRAARSTTVRVAPECRATSGSAASAATARPTNSVDSVLAASSGVRSMRSVCIQPGDTATAVTPAGASSAARPTGIRLTAVLITS